MTATTQESLDKTVHLLRMKHDPEYAALQADIAQAHAVLARRAAEKAKAADIQKAVFHSTMTVNGVGGVTHEDSAELQKMAAVLATMEIVGSPDEKLRIMRGYLDGSL